MEPITRLIGLSLNNFGELGTDNIKAFNTVAMNQKGINYFSIGGEKMPAQATELFRYTGQLIFDKNTSGLPIDNDGIFGYDEIQWGTHLINMEADHAEIIGIGEKFNAQKTFKVIADLLKKKHSEQAQ
eukprot:TRINITY_DN23445_c0_g1_i1.p2 TRINITY_DN23445_c0_g1~~TRINITY_DN23445_c0_g1_i1.p2  ORF type:complete len:128 (+),score=28.34 TRINITY_DN23445_c0_g1_i1:335-718(+)